jgi:hypothetical protein
MILGSTGCQPVVGGSLPATRLQSANPNMKQTLLARPGDVLGRLPSTAGWQPALPSIL